MLKCEICGKQDATSFWEYTIEGHNAFLPEAKLGTAQPVSYMVSCYASNPTFITKNFGEIKYLQFQWYHQGATLLCQECFSKELLIFKLKGVQCKMHDLNGKGEMGDEKK